MHAPAIDGIDDAVVFGMYFLNAESYVVDDDIEITSTSEAELDSSSAIALWAVTLDTGLEDERLESGSIIFAIENFNGNVVLCCCGCLADVFDGEIVIIDGDDNGDAVIIECVLFAAVSIIGLFDVNGTPDGLRGCIPEEIYKSNKNIEHIIIEFASKISIVRKYFLRIFLSNKGLNKKTPQDTEIILKNEKNEIEFNE